MQIYSTVPTQSEVDYVEKTIILNFLKENQGKFFTARKLAQIVGLPTTGTQVEVRKLITELIEIEKVPVVSNTIGFAYCDNKRAILTCIEGLEYRIKGLQRRIDAYREMLE